MGSALLKGWLKTGLKSIAVVEPKPSAELRKLAKAKTISLFAVPSAVKQKPSVCVVAIKPQILKGEAPALADFASRGALMISIAAGTSVAALTKAWGKKARIIRAMPNTPGAIGAGITGIYAQRANGVQKNALCCCGAGRNFWVSRKRDRQCHGSTVRSAYLSSWRCPD